MKFFKISLSVVLGMLLAANMAFAQGQQQQQPPPQQQEPAVDPESVTDEELAMFAEISNKAEEVQADAEEKVSELVEDEGMEMDRFQEIMMSQQNPQMSEEVEVSDEENEKIEKIQPEIMEINQDAQEQFVTIIEDEGLDPQRFQEIFQAIQSSPELMERFEEIQGNNEG